MNIIVSFTYTRYMEEEKEVYCDYEVTFLSQWTVHTTSKQQTKYNVHCMCLTNTCTPCNYRRSKILALKIICGLNFRVKYFIARWFHNAACTAFKFSRV